MTRMPTAPDNRQYTLIVVSDHSQAVRKFRMPRRWLKRGIIGGGVAALFGLLTVSHYFTLLSSSSENRVLKEENAQLKSQVLLVQEKVAHVQATLDRVARFDAKLRNAVTNLQDPERNLAMGPLDAPGGQVQAAAPAGLSLPAASPPSKTTRTGRRPASGSSPSTSRTRSRCSPRPRRSGPPRAG